MNSFCTYIILNVNKKILLRQRKRYTASCVGEGGIPTLAGGRGVPTLGYPPILIWLGGTYLGWGRGYLPWGTPSPDLAGEWGTYLGQGSTYLGVLSILS